MEARGGGMTDWRDEAREAVAARLEALADTPAEPAP